MSENTATYMERPFISYDAPDNDGVREEIKVTKGTAVVDNRQESAKMVKYHFIADNLKKHNGFPASISKDDKEIIRILDESLENGTPVYVRKETVRDRKKHTDRSVPIEDIKDNEKFARVAAVKDENGEYIFASNNMALTNPKEDPVTGPKSALDMDIPDEIPVNNAKQSFPSRNTHAVELPAWEKENRDGATNPGSFVTQANVSAYFFAVEKLKAAGLSTDHEDVLPVAEEILRAADILQLLVYKKTEGREDVLDSADRSINSHSRARHIIFEMINNLHPITEDAVEAIKSKEKATVPTPWMKEIISASKVIFFWSNGYDENGVSF